MKIVVCIKHVPDTAAKISIVGKTQIDSSVKFVLNPYDEYAVEEAVALQAKVGGEVVFISIGNKDAMNSMRAAMAMGGDRGFLVIDDKTVDHMDIAQTIATVIKNDGGADMIFMGKQTVDSEGMQTTYRVAELLGMPVASQVVKFDKQDNHVIVECELDGGARQVSQLSIPCVIGATKGLNTPRYPKLPDHMKAKKKPVTEIAFSSLNINTQGSHIILEELTLPAEKAVGKIINGDNAQLAVEQLIKLLKEEAKII